MRFTEFKIKPKTNGEIPLDLPDTKGNFLKVLNYSDKLEIQGYNPTGHPNSQVINIIHKCDNTKSEYTISIFYHSGSFMSPAKYWKYTIISNFGNTEEEGILGSKEINEINEILKLSSFDFRFNIKKFLNYCLYTKINSFQILLSSGGEFINE